MSSKDKVPTMVRLEPELRNTMENEAKNENMSLSSYIAKCIEKRSVSVDTINIYTGNIINHNYGSNSEKHEFVDANYTCK